MGPESSVPHKAGWLVSTTAATRFSSLPPIHNLSIPQSNLRSVDGRIQKIIISCSDPESEECRVMMSFNNTNRLAFCCPSTTEWTIIQSQQATPYDCYDDFVYCGTKQLLFSVKCIDEFEAWDLRNPLSPSLVWSCRAQELEVGSDSYGQSNFVKKPEDWVQQWWPVVRQYLVVSQQGELFIVRRFINQCTLPDGMCAPLDLEEYIMDIFTYPSKTADFDVHKIVRDGDGGKLVEMDGHLDGLVMFIGDPSVGMAIPAADADGFQPNSICFTDDAYTAIYGTDNGVFDYKKKTFSSCYYPRDYQSLINKILPPPLWLTPNEVGKNKGGGREVCSSTCKEVE